MASKNAWFKHYNTASDGATLRTLWDNGDYEAYGFWWKFHELLSRFEDEAERGKMTVSWSVLARETGWKPSKCRRVLARICSVSKIEMDENQDGNVTFLSPNWLDLQEKRGRKKGGKNTLFPTEVRGENLEERRRENSSSFATIFKTLAIITVDGWNQKYGKEFVDKYGPEAVEYYSNDPKSAQFSPMIWASKIGGSLARQKAYDEQQAKESIRGGAGDICGIAE